MKKMQSLGFMGMVLFVAIIANLGTAHAIKNPLIRNCLPEGYMWSVTTEAGELPLCLMDGAAIGAQDIFAFKTESTKSQSIRLFLNLTQPNDPEGSCITQAGRVWSGTDSDGKIWKVCQLSDGSLVELGTLGRGSAHPNNGVLRALLLSR